MHSNEHVRRMSWQMVTSINLQDPGPAVDVGLFGERSTRTTGGGGKPQLWCGPVR